MYISLEDYQDKEICDSFCKEGQEIEFFSFPEKVTKEGFVNLSEKNRYALAMTLQKRNYDMVFSLSYLHEISAFCNMLGVIYLSWTIEYPAMDLYRDSVKNPCNCFFISNPREIERLQSMGVENVFFLPAAASASWMEEEDSRLENETARDRKEDGNKEKEEPEGEDTEKKDMEKNTEVSDRENREAAEENRMGNAELSEEAIKENTVENAELSEEAIKEKTVENIEPPDPNEEENDTNQTYEVSFIGRLKESAPDSPLGDVQNLSPECRGYLDGLIHCQRITYGYDVLQHGVPTYVMKELLEKYPLVVPKDVSGGVWNMYVKKYMLDQISYQERRVLLQNVNFDLTTFLDWTTEEEVSYQIQALPETQEQFQEIIKNSKVNLCIIDRQYEEAVPRQIFEMMANCSLVLCNKHAGMEQIWSKGEEFADFEDAVDLDMKLRIYLSNEERRQEMEEKAKAVTRKEHQILNRVRTILEIIGQ